MHGVGVSHGGKWRQLYSNSNKKIKGKGKLKNKIKWKCNIKKEEKYKKKAKVQKRKYNSIPELLESHVGLNSTLCIVKDGNV